MINLTWRQERVIKKTAATIILVNSLPLVLVMNAAIRTGAHESLLNLYLYGLGFWSVSLALVEMTALALRWMGE